MSDVIHSLLRSDRAFLAVSFALFAIAGSVNATTDSLGPTAVGTVLAIGGVYAVARFARAVSRKQLATIAVSLWCIFLGIAGIYALGAETVRTALPSVLPLSTPLIQAVTVATLLLACATTVFLGFREYGVTPGTETGVSDEQVVESDSDYSVR